VAAALNPRGYAHTYLVGKGSAFLSYRLYTSEAILLEVQEKLEQFFGTDRNRIFAMLRQIREVATVVYPTRKVEAVRDHDDDKILECTVEAGAEVVVSFDKDLLDMKEYNAIKIIHPSQLQYLFS